MITLRKEALFGLAMGLAGAVNAAQPATDSTTAQPAMDNATVTTTATTTVTKPVAAPVNINTADATALAAVKGISKKQAAAIVDYRTKNGDFKSVDDLKNVKGFGPKTMKRIASKVTV